MGLVVVSVSQIVNMRWLPKQIGNHEIDHVGIATMILAQVKNQGIGMRHKIHRGHDRRSTDVRVWKRAELDIANVVIEDLHLRESAVVMFYHRAEPCFISWARLVRPVNSAGFSRQHVRIVSDKQMSILADSA